MRKWFLPLTVFGLGSLGAYFATKATRQTMGDAVDQMADAEDPIAEWNTAVDREIENLRLSVNKIAQALEPSLESKDGRQKV